MIGIDLIQISKFRRFYDNASEEQLGEIFDEEERGQVNGRGRPEIGLAARFAAKEAVIKVLEDIDAFAFRWTDIKVQKKTSGKPTVRLYGLAAELAKKRGIERIEISMTHTNEYAAAQALAVRKT